MEFWNELLKVRKPTFAAVVGDCHGGGLELALACDVVFAEMSASFALPGIQAGLMPGCGGTQRLTRRVGKARAMEMILLGEPLGAYDAKRQGICTRVLPTGEVTMAAFDAAQQIARLSAPVLALAKEAVNAAFEMPLEEGLMLEKRDFWSIFALEDPHEGMAAALEGRAAVFRHR